MNFVFVLCWIVILSTAFTVIIYFLQYLLIRPNRRALSGLVAMSLLTAMAIIGLIFFQIHPVAITTHITFLVLSVLFINQIIYQWTFPNKLMQRRYWRIGLKIGTAYVIVYVILVILALLFHL